MGLAASQARLLSLTSRIHDVEFEAQQLHYAKLKLALLEDDVYKRYEEMLDEENLTIPGANGTRIPATFDNLCGEGSINNNLGTSKHYIFRGDNDELIVPTNVYNGYLNYGGSDPYEFAMYMMGVKIGANDDTERALYDQEVENLFQNDSNSSLRELRDTINKQIDSLYSESTSAGDGSPDEFRKSVYNALIAQSDLASFFEAQTDPDDPTKKTFCIPDKLKDTVKSLQKNMQQLQHDLFKKNNGAKNIFEKITNEDFDKNKFNYYVRWGQLIENAGGIDNEKVGLLGCEPASDYEGLALEKNAEVLNQALITGHISIDVVYDNRDGGITWEPTSAATDSIINMDKLTSIDSDTIKVALKKAEAEKERKLKEISRIDKNYDLTLNRLETERTALTTEYDSVKKVISDNVERSFGIFS